MSQQYDTADFENKTGRKDRVSVRPRRMSWSAIAAVWAVVFMLVWNFVRSQQTTGARNPDAEARPVTPRGGLWPQELAFIELFREASPSVVFITSIELRREIFSMNVFEIPQGAGSGFIWNEEGHLVTNYHVIRNASAVEVTLADQSTWPAKFVGAEPDKDLAVLKIDAPASRLRPIPVGTSSDLLVGQSVFAIGNPFGFDQTLTTGLVSALGRDIPSMTGRPIRDMIQTDAAINPGNSGGPLLDSAGRLIGVNTQIASPSGGSSGIGFAVPVDIVNRVVPQLIKHGKVIRPGLGIQPFPDNVTRQLSLEGVLLADVIPRSGAELAGLRGTILTRTGSIRRLGDIITAVEGKPVRSVYDLLDILEERNVGESVRVSVRRGDETLEFTVELQSIS
jgi:S1-C subfamily serine protease